MIQMFKTALGAGLRSVHFPELLKRRSYDRRSSTIEWFEIITENYLTTQGRPRWILEQLRHDYPIAFHGVSLSIGSPEPLNNDYLNHLKKLILDLDPFLVSDHFCWTGLNQVNTHNLLPFPLTLNHLDLVCSKIDQIQNFLGRPMLFENASVYMSFKEDEMSEWDFISEVCKKTGCKLLLDINNIFVTSYNLNLDPYDIIKKIPVASVAQIHLAGHTDMGHYLFDTHSNPVPDSVWKLYRFWLEQSQQFTIPTMIEWDDQIPLLEILEEEVGKIKLNRDKVFISTRESSINEMPL